MTDRFLCSEHWTDEQLIDHLYGIGSPNRHVEACKECGSRLAAMQLSRNSVEARARAGADLNMESLAAQRRAIYARLGQRPNWLPALHFQKWAPAVCCLAVLCGGFAAWEHRTEWAAASHQQVQRAKVSDEQLADEVSQVADHAEPDAAAPLQALFEN